MTAKAWSALALLLLWIGVSPLFAVNLLTNPGFEDGQTGWADPNPVYGGVSRVITNAALAHTGNNCISNYNAGGISGPEQGDTMGGWSSGVSLPIFDGNFYKLSAYVKVPGASTNAQAITLRYRFEPSATRTDVGTRTVNTENWTLVQSGWLKPNPGDYYESYWIVHSINNGIMFYADDCALEEAVPLTLQGRVITNGVGVDGANVSAVSADYSSPATTTVGGGYYTFTVPPGTYSIGANIPGLLGTTNVTVNSDPTTANDIVLNTDPDYDPDLILFARSSTFNPGAPWPTAFPAGGALSLINNPGVKSFGGVQWENNDAVNSTGFLLGTYNTAIPANGASVVLVAKRKPSIASDNWDSIVDVFYDRLVLGLRNDTGVVNVRRNGSLNYSTNSIPVGQTTVLSLVVQPDGTYNVWANGVSIMTNATTSDMTSLVPMVPGAYANGINVGRNNPDTWTTFNGYIGDVYIYHVALDDAKRQSLEASLMSKFITNATLSYTIVSSADANGSISPAGANNVVQGNDQTYSITANAGYVVSDVLVDGASVGAKTTYTFTDVSTNHTIAASFIALPPQTITATAGANGTISPSGAVNVAAGGNQTFSIFPNTGYAVANVLVDGISQGEIYNYTFNFVTAPHSISVTFRALNMAVPRPEQLVFGAVSSVLPGDDITITNWPAYVPADKTLVTIGSPTSTLIKGPVATNIWENNNSGTFDGYRYPGGAGGGGEYLSPIPCSGATIVAVAAPKTTYVGGDPWTSIVDVFYDQLVLGIRNNDGTVVARVKGGGAVYGSDVIPYDQPTVLTLVVQPNGDYKVWANTALMLSGSSSTFTNLSPGANTFQHYINVGRNNPDGWTAFNGNIGDVFLYKTALTDTERQQLEATLMAKFGAPLPPKFAWKGPNNGNWSNPANWSDSVPTTGNLAVFSDTNTAGATVQLDTAVYAKGIEFNNLVPNTTIASSLGNTLTLDNGSTTALAPLTTDAGTHTISAAVDALVGITKSGPGKVTLSGSLNLGTVATVNPVLVVSDTDSELEIAGAATVGFTKSVGLHGGGKLIVSGTVMSQDADQKIGDDWGAGPGYLELKGTGSWTHTSTGSFIVGTVGSGNPGTVTINDNALLDLTANGPLYISLGFGGGTTGTVVQNGGTVKTVPYAQAWRTGYGPGVMLGQWTDSPCNAIYSLNGGVLQIPSIGNIAWDGANNVVVNPASLGSTAVLNLNGGTIKATDNDSTDPDAIAEGTAHLIFNTTHTWVQAGGAKIDVAGHNNSVAVILEHDAALGSTLDGGLHVMDSIGGGTLSLLELSTYTGPLTVDTGVSVNLAYTGNQNVSGLKVNGASQAPGVYGSTATNPNGVFSGPGTVTVVTPPPPTPVLPPGSITVSGGVPTFSFGTVAGYKYRMVYKNSLTDPTWTAVIDPPNYPAPDGWGGTSTGLPATISDPSAPGQPQRFYRVEALNP